MKKRLIDANALRKRHCEGCKEDIREMCRVDPICASLQWVDEEPTVDAVELPKGKPGDYLEWDNGTGFKQVYAINAVMICEDCIRYDLEKFAPVINHPGIVRFLTLEEAEREWKEMCEKLRAEEQTFTAKKDGVGNG